MEVVQVPTSKTIPEVARLLADKGIKFEKSIEQSSGSYVLRAEYKRVKLHIFGVPPEGCKIERIEEEVDVPEVPAHKEKKVRFVPVGNCEPLLAMTSEREPEIEPVPSDIPF